MAKIRGRSEERTRETGKREDNVSGGAARLSFEVKKEKGTKSQEIYTYVAVRR